MTIAIMGGLLWLLAATLVHQRIYFLSLKRRYREICSSLRSSDDMLNKELQTKTIRPVMAAKDLPPGNYTVLDDIVVVESERSGAKYSVYRPSLEGQNEFKVLPAAQRIIPVLRDGELELPLRK